MIARYASMATFQRKTKCLNLNLGASDDHPRLDLGLNSNVCDSVTLTMGGSDCGHRFARDPYAAERFASEFEWFTGCSTRVNTHACQPVNIEQVNTHPAKTIMKRRMVEILSL